jgi:hypothetical protein
MDCEYIDDEAEPGNPRQIEAIVNVLETPHSVMFFYVCDVCNFELGTIAVHYLGEDFAKYEAFFKPGHVLKIRGTLYDDNGLYLEGVEFQRER